MLALLAALWIGPALAQDGELNHLVVLHTNDVHGQVLPRPATWLKDRDPLPDSGGLARVAAYVNEVRAEQRAAGGDVLVVDAGDWSQGTPEGAVGDGRPFLEAFALIEYDAMCVGNHEFDKGVETFLGHLEAARLPALLANATDAKGEYLAGTRPYIIVERAGMRIGLVGLLTTGTPSITDHSTRAMQWRAPEIVLAEIEKELAGKVDWILPLTHVGVDGDRVLARAHPDLDLIVGGHSHTYLRNGKNEGSTLIVQMGSKASGVGRVDLWFDPATERIVKKEARIVNLYEEPREQYRNKPLERACERLVNVTTKHMQGVVGKLAAPLARGRSAFTSSPCGNLVTDAMRARTKADFAFTNRGGLRADLPAGPVTRRYLFQVLPFGNHLVTFELTGRELIALIEDSVEGRRQTGLEISGARIEVRRTGGGYDVVRVLVGGEAVKASGAYRVTTNSFLAGGGDGFRELEERKGRVEDPVLLRQMLEEAFDGGTLTPPSENRYVLLK
jgi:2',3'-cyclic-nucleotide 2'-phosphodiesterase (5'-nucleotidase family)